MGGDVVLFVRESDYSFCRTAHTSEILLSFFFSGFVIDLRLSGIEKTLK